MWSVGGEGLPKSHCGATLMENLKFESALNELHSCIWTNIKHNSWLTAVFWHSSREHLDFCTSKLLAWRGSGPPSFDCLKLKSTPPLNVHQSFVSQSYELKKLYIAAWRVHCMIGPSCTCWRVTCWLSCQYSAMGANIPALPRPPWGYRDVVVDIWHVSTIFAYVTISVTTQL